MEKELIQEEQYSFPYHHLTHEKDGALFLFEHLFWGLVHYTYISHVLEVIKKTNFSTLADVGCGEGRIITEIEKIRPDASLSGFDISERAIRFAHAFSRSSTFEVHDITKDALPTKVDCVVSCEVIEHIEPEKVQTYIKNIHSSLTLGGTIIITTPTKNVPVNPKHYQHFTSEMFDELLNGKFSNISYTYLNRVNWRVKVLERILSNRFFLSNNVTVNRIVLNLYKKYFLYASKKTGERIMTVAKKI